MAPNKYISTHNVPKECRRKFLYSLAPGLALLFSLLVYTLIIDTDWKSRGFVFVMTAFGIYVVYEEMSGGSLKRLKSIVLYDNGIEWIDESVKRKLFVSFTDIADVHILYNTERNYKHTPNKLLAYGSALNVVTKAGQEEFIYDCIENFLDVFSELRKKGYPSLDEDWIDEDIRISLL